MTVQRSLRTLGLVAVMVCGIGVREACAYRPAGWIYLQTPYLWDLASSEWMYLDATSTMRCCNYATGEWSSLAASGLNGGWVYVNWPYAYCYSQHTWYYLLESDVLSCYRFSSGQWSFLGDAQSVYPVHFYRGEREYGDVHDRRCKHCTLRTYSDGTVVMVEEMDVWDLMPHVYLYTASSCSRYEGTYSGSTGTLRWPSSGVVMYNLTLSASWVSGSGDGSSSTFVTALVW